MRRDDNFDVPVPANAAAVLNEPAFAGFRTRHRTEATVNAVRIKIDLLVFYRQSVLRLL